MGHHQVSLPRRTLPALAALALACAAVGRPDPPEPRAPDGPRTGVAPEDNPFLHASGRELVDGEGRKVVLRGVCFGNAVWSDPHEPPRAHHGEADYRYLHTLGANAVRFYLNAGLFEAPGAPGAYRPDAWAWLDQNFAWARASGIYIVLNLHVPSGGYQSQGHGSALWLRRDHRDRFVALWRAIAERYRDEPALAGYDLLNEPVTSRSAEEWENLARRTTAAIRERDPRHAIFVERTNGVYPDWSPDRNGEMNFFLVNDTNVVYEFHFYEPLAFTHQGAPWVPRLTGVRARYPGPVPGWDGVPRVVDRDRLDRELARYFAFGERHQVPVFLGEFGVYRAAFERDRNGAGWVADVADLARAHGVGFTYHAYHEGGFGLFASDEKVPPAQLNRSLEDVLRASFR